MPRILVAGCGYVGERAADLLHEAGWIVEGWTASQESAARLNDKPYRVRAVNIADVSAVSEMRSDFGAVVHCASSGGGGVEEYRRTYYEGAINLIKTFPAATLLLTSSTSVYAQRDGSWVDETSATEPSRETAKILIETEMITLAHKGIVARLAGIYGPGRSFFLRRFLAGEANVDLTNERYVNQVHRDDIATALILLLSHYEPLRQGATAGERNIFNVVDNRPFLTREIYEWLATHLSMPAISSGTDNAYGKRGESNKRVSNRKLRALGWGPKYPTFEEGMATSVIPSFGDLHAS